MEGVPWHDRFCVGQEKIREIAQVLPEPLEGLNNDSVETAIMRLEAAHERLFVVTDYLLDRLLTLVGIATAHSKTTYSSVGDFQSGIYAASPPLNKTAPLIWVTGLAGVGKSALVAATLRVLRAISPQLIEVPGIGALSLVPAWDLEIGDRRGERAVLNALFDQAVLLDYEARGIAPGLRTDITTAKSIPNLLNALRMRAYRDGVSIVAISEFQFFTRSANANSLVTGMLLNLRKIGVPCIIDANYSLGHRLKRRNQEDLDRFFERAPMVLVPDLACSKDWIAVLKGFVAISPEIFNLNADEDAEGLHKYCAGVKRYLARLIRVAYRIALDEGKKIDLAILECASKSHEFANDKLEIEKIKSIASGAASPRKDLECPFSIPKQDIVLSKQQEKSKAVEEAATVFLGQQLTANEQEVVSALRSSAKGGKHKGGANVTPIGRTKKQLTFEQLRDAEQRRRDEQSK